METRDICFFPMTKQANLIRRKEISPVELLSAYLQQIERVGFIFFVGYSLVLVVDLSRYEQLGMLLGGGLLLGVAMMLVYFWTIGRRARPPTGIVSSQTTCSSCKCSVLSGNFCGKCGKQLLLTDQLVENLIKCPSCEAYNSSASQRCRICGNELPGLSPTVVTSKNNEKGTSRAKTN